MDFRFPSRPQEDGEGTLHVRMTFSGDCEMTATYIAEGSDAILFTVKGIEGPGKVSGQKATFIRSRVSRMKQCVN